MSLFNVVAFWVRPVNLLAPSEKLYSAIWVGVAGVAPDPIRLFTTLCAEVCRLSDLAA